MHFSACFDTLQLHPCMYVSLIHCFMGLGFEGCSGLSHLQAGGGLGVGLPWAQRQSPHDKHFKNKAKNDNVNVSFLNKHAVC